MCILVNKKKVKSLKLVPSFEHYPVVKKDNKFEGKELL